MVVPAILTSPPIPTPPATTKAPLAVVDEEVVLENVAAPVEAILKATVPVV